MLVERVFKGRNNINEKYLNLLWKRVKTFYGIAYFTTLCLIFMAETLRNREVKIENAKTFSEWGQELEKKNKKCDFYFFKKITIKQVKDSKKLVDGSICYFLYLYCFDTCCYIFELEFFCKYFLLFLFFFVLFYKKFNIIKTIFYFLIVILLSMIFGAIIFEDKEFYLCTCSSGENSKIKKTTSQFNSIQKFFVENFIFSCRNLNIAFILSCVFSFICFFSFSFYLYQFYV
jgi:hypothetical protein